MTIAETIQALLVGASVPATIGDLPSTSHDAVGIELFDGDFNTEYFGGRLGSTIYQPVVKIVVRNKSYEQGKQYIDVIKNALHRYTNGVNILSILLVGSPLYLGRSDQKLHEFQITFSVQGVD